MTSAYHPVEAALSAKGSGIQSVVQGLIAGGGHSVGESKQGRGVGANRFGFRWMEGIPQNGLEELRVWEHHGTKPRGRRAFMSGCQTSVGW